MHPALRDLASGSAGYKDNSKPSLLTYISKLINNDTHTTSTISP